MKDLDLGEPKSCFDHVYLGCTQRECQISKDIVDDYRSMFGSRISAGATEKLSETKATGKTWCRNNIFMVLWHGRAMQRNAWNDIANLPIKLLSNFFKVATPCMFDHQFKEEENGSVGEFSTVCSQIVLKCSYLARIGSLDIFWSVHKPARAVTKWTKACDKRLALLIAYIHHTSEYRQYCYVGNTAQQCRLRLFQDSDFAGDRDDSKTTSRGILRIFGSRTFRANKLDR